MKDKEKILYLEKSNNQLKQEVQKLRAKIKSYKYDELTGFLRRKDFNDRFDEMWHEYNEFGHRFIMAMVDLDGLHELNRELSFEAGDEFIVTVADQIKLHFEDSNLFRIGGDEFMILKRGNDKEDFDSRLNLIENCTVFSVAVQDGFGTEVDMFNAVDDGIKERKKMSKCPNNGNCELECNKECTKR